MKDKKTGIIAIGAVVMLLAGFLIWAAVLEEKNGSSQSETTAGDGTSGSSDTESSTDAVMAVSTGKAREAVDGAGDGEWQEIILSDDGCSVPSGAEILENEITVTSGGYYVISGQLTEGRIVVDAGDSSSVVIRLGGVSISNTVQDVLHVKSAGSIVIYLDDDTENTLTSGSASEITQNPNEGSTESDENEDTASGAALCSKTNLVIGGDGTLNVYGYINNGIHSKTSLSIEGGTINVTAVNNGIKGKTSVNVTGGSISVVSGNDGIKSDGTEDGQAYVNVAGGTVDVTSYGDGIQADNTLTVTGGQINITAISSVSADTNGQDFMEHGFGGADSGWDMAAETDISAKGLKAGTLISISGGLVKIDAGDDGIHSNGNVLVSGGEVTVKSGDDGIHADTEVTISDGILTITESYEGVEGNQIYVKGGTLSVTASDDGFNASGGNTSGGFGFGWGRSSSDEDMPNLYIEGGTIYVNAGGDGLDSNGNLYVNGGTTIVDGPTDSGNGALDSGSESGGVIQVNGGTIIAVGASGMAESFESDSEQCSFSVTMSSYWSAGDTITIEDSDGNEIFSYEAAKTGNSIVFSSADLTIGEEYTVSAGDLQITVSQDSQSSGSSGGGMSGGFGGGGMGGGHGMGGR